MTDTPTKTLRDVRLDKLAALKDQGINPFAYVYDRTHTAAALQEKYAALLPETVTSDEVRVAGRIMAIRNSGMFVVIDDGSATIQIFCQEPSLSSEQMEKLPLFDIGDWMGISGIVRRTKRGELTINAAELIMLSKSLLPLPEKYHGLTDVETRYRQRYLDLITNEEARKRLRQRSLLIRTIREVLNEKGFLEVETPMLQTIAGGAAAKPFVTHHNALNIQMYLRIAPELFLKRLIVGGLSDRVYEINRCFRNEGLSPKHNPEFTTLELYQAFADYHDMMDLTEEIVKRAAMALTGDTTVTYGDKTISFGGAWVRKSMIALVEEKTGINFLPLSQKEAYEKGKTLKLDIKPTDSWGKIIEVAFSTYVEPTLIQPTHVIDYPREISPLAKVHRLDERLTERFETFTNGWEIANAFSELTDPIDQRSRFEEQVKNKETGDDEAHPMDEDFIIALEHGLPPTGGLGIGIDRLCMLLTNATTIRDVIAFPTMKPIIK